METTWISKLGEQEGFQVFFNCIRSDKQSGRTNFLRHIVPQGRSCIGQIALKGLSVHKYESIVVYILMAL